MMCCDAHLGKLVLFPIFDRNLDNFGQWEIDIPFSHGLNNSVHFASTARPGSTILVWCSYTISYGEHKFIKKLINLSSPSDWISELASINYTRLCFHRTLHNVSFLLTKLLVFSEGRRNLWQISKSTYRINISVTKKSSNSLWYSSTNYYTYINTWESTYVSCNVSSTSTSLTSDGQLLFWWPSSRCL